MQKELRALVFLRKLLRGLFQVRALGGLLVDLQGLGLLGAFKVLL